jgi:hypothetical protein
MTIDKLEVNGIIASAEGTFSIMDHFEGCPANDPWMANGTLEGQKFSWIVRRKVPGPGDFCFESKEGEPLFTLSGSVNDAIKVSITKKLDYVIAELEKDPSITKIEDKPKIFKGQRYKYTGLCVCINLRISNLQRPFDWNAHTNNCQFPQKCFECSCGQQWFRADDERWVHVGDEATWQMLIVHDGEIVQPVGLDPESKGDVPMITLLENIRRRGFIPMS